MSKIVIEGQGKPGFFGAQMLFDIDIAGRKGEIRGIVRGNGARKSMLTNLTYPHFYTSGNREGRRERSFWQLGLRSRIV